MKMNAVEMLILVQSFQLAVRPNDQILSSYRPSRPQYFDERGYAVTVTAYKLQAVTDGVSIGLNNISRQ